ncbi:MAG: hypothetical protein HUU46_03405 [Candidatus Hydrogenedentes bacterium]|nr:hypothetical protein [Candidatus Hydrogenedentota bacterium]
MSNTHSPSDLGNDRNESPLAGWTPEQIEQGKQWVEAWKRAGEAMEKLRAEELQKLDGYRAIEMLCGDYDYTVEPRAPKPYSGLVEQQYWFKKAAGRD